MDIKLRYEKRNSCFTPQFSIDGKQWKCFKKENLDGKTLRIAEKLGEAVYDAHIWYSDTQELYFKHEITVNAFLAAAKIMFKTEVIEFEHLN